MESTPQNSIASRTDPMNHEVDLINISSSSGEEFMVEPLSVNDLDERFRTTPYPLTDMSTVFMGAAGAMLFPNSVNPQGSVGQQIDTRGSQIENELMDLMDDISNISSLTFIGSSSEEDDPFFGANFANVEQNGRNSYGRPVQRVQPMVRTPQVTRETVNPPLVPSNRSAFSVVIPEQRRAPEIQAHPSMQANYLPMPVPFYPNNWNNITRPQQHFNGQAQFQSQGPTNGPILQMNPPVMPEVAGFCAGCSKTYDQIVVETLTHYVAWSEYPDETIRDRNVRSRAFVDGFGAALICFKNAGLSPTYPCEMSGVQHQ